MADDFNESALDIRLEMTGDRCACLAHVNNQLLSILKITDHLANLC